MEKGRAEIERKKMRKIKETQDEYVKDKRIYHTRDEAIW